MFAFLSNIIYTYIFLDIKILDFYPLLPHFPTCFEISLTKGGGNDSMPPEFPVYLVTVKFISVV